MSSEFFGEEVEHSNMDRWIGTTAVVTGASSGIGAALCEALVKLGINVVGVARRLELMQDLAGRVRGEPGKFHALRCDLRKEQDMRSAFDWIDENLGAISILINNAGIMVPTTLIDGELDDWRSVFDINVLALSYCTKRAIASMKINNNDGYIIHINSVAGHSLPPVPELNMYPASKHAVTVLTELLRRELHSIPAPLIKITSVSPGLVTTDMLGCFSALVGDAMITAPALKTSDIADTIIYLLNTPPHVQIHEIIIKVAGEQV